MCTTNLYGVLHHRGERDAEPTDLEEHGRVGFLAEAVEADARSDGRISRAERVKLVPKAGSSNTLSAGFLAFAKPTYSIQRHPSLNREPCEQSKKPEHISCVRKLVRKLVGA